MKQVESGVMKDMIYNLVRRIVPNVRYRGLKIPIANPPISRKIFKQLVRQSYEVPELAAIFGLLRDGDRMLELGTGLGVVSGLASRFRKDVVVRSYEGNPDLISFISNMHLLNAIEKIDLRNEILLPNPTTMAVEFLTHRSFAESSIVEHGAIVQRVQVPCRDINSVLAEFRPDLFVCDIEGGESRVFDGIQLQGIRAVVIELHPAVIDRLAIKRVYDCCAAAGLYPRVELSSATVVAFERVGDP